MSQSTICSCHHYGYSSKEELRANTARDPNCQHVWTLLTLSHSVPKYLKFKLQFMNGRGTIANIRLVQAVLILHLHLKVLQSEDIKLGVIAYSMACREQVENDKLELTFERIQRALRVKHKLLMQFCGKAISRKVLLLWVQRSSSLLEYKKAVPNKLACRSQFKQIDVIADDNDVTISD